MYTLELDTTLLNEKEKELYAKFTESGHFRLQLVLDELMNIENLKGDCFNPEVNTDIAPATLKQQEKEYEERINSDGVWGVVGEYTCPACDAWHQGDSVWGFVGTDWAGSGYLEDIMQGTMNERPKEIKVIAKRWFQKTWGNTYHAVRVYVDGESVGHVAYTYGYGEQYEQTALDILVEAGIYTRPEHPLNLRRIVEEEHNDKYLVWCYDVERKRDMVV